MGKAEDEMAVFLAFEEAAGLGVEVGSVKSENPPIPDISCIIHGERCFFELTRVADQAIADDVGRIHRIFRKTGKAPLGKLLSYSDEEIVKKAICNKAGKTYQIDGSRFDLLVYCDGFFHGRIDPNFVFGILTELGNQYSDKWDKIWVFDQQAGAIIWPEQNK